MPQESRQPSLADIVAAALASKDDGKKRYRPATRAECENLLQPPHKFQVGMTIKKVRTCCEVIDVPAIGQEVIVTQVLAQPLRLSDEPASPAGAVPLDIAIALARDCTDPACPVGVHIVEALADSREFDLVDKKVL